MEADRDTRQKQVGGTATEAPPALELSTLKDMSVTDLTHIARQLDVPGATGMRKQELIFQILRARMEFPEQKYLIQATVVPRTIHGQPAWFRVFYSAGKTYPCWWHPLTHVFSIVTPADENKYTLLPLHDITQRIASLCKLDWFSTEIALTLEEFVVVDYVNDAIDTRIQSKAADGVPDEVMRAIAGKLAGLVKERS